MRATATAWAAVLAAVATVAAACAAPPAVLPELPRSGGLRVMTWNVLGAQADASVFDEHAGWAARVDQLRPEVLVVQEVQADDLAALLERPATRYVAAAHLQWECDLKPSREGVAVLVRSDVPVTGGGGRHLGTSCADPTMRRVLVWADLVVGGGELRVYGTHLTAGGGAAAASREAQVRELRAVAAADDADGDRRWLLAGDVNAHPGERAYGLLAGEGAVDGAPVLRDAAAEVGPAAGDPVACPAVASTDLVGLAALWADPALVRRCGYTAGWPKDDNWLACDLLSLCVSWEARRDSTVRIRIDHVWRPAGGPLRPAAAWVPNRLDPDWAAPGTEWFRLSDHLPLVVDLEVDPVAEPVGDRDRG